MLKPENPPWSPPAVIPSFSWSDILGDEKAQPYFRALLARVQRARIECPNEIFPGQGQLFRAFQLTPFSAVRVVILGQDPYHGPNQADGLAFSVARGEPLPPSLQNIYRAIQLDYPQCDLSSHGSLEGWTAQGVFLLNTVLSVQRGQAHSHAGWGWEQFTDQVLQQLSAHHEALVFLLWGNAAQKKQSLLDASKHRILCAPHPSPLSVHRGFYQAHHFKRTNEWLESQGRTPIDWGAL